jgi:hypothetical protein
MTVTHHGGPGAPYPPAGVPAPGPSAASPPPGGPPGYDWRYAPPAPRRSKLLAAGVVLAILLATAALVIGIILLAQPTPTPAAASPAPPTSNATATGDTTEADRTLCTTIAPLMAENDQFSNAYVRLGDAGTPGRDAATPKFITDTQDWIRRIQPVLDQNPNVDPFFQRSLQRYVDDQHLIVLDLTPGPLTSYAKVLFSDSVGAYSGPLHLCDGLGVKW